MGIGAPNPGIWGEVVRKSLGSSQDEAARRRDAAGDQAALDAAEFRELERAQLYSGGPDPGVPSPKRSFLDRLLRR